MKNTYWMLALALVSLLGVACSMDTAEWDRNHPVGAGASGGSGGTGGSGCPSCGGTGGSGQLCSPGSQAACQCSSNVWGQMTCNADGKGYGACQCVPGGTFCHDADGDGFGNPQQCEQFQTPPSGWVPNNGDCNDACSTCHPGGVEICGNGLDEDCNGSDLACQQNHTYYRDQDGDGFGNPNQSIQSTSSTPPQGYVTDNTDCDDNNAAVHNTCGQNHTYYRDADGDGFGNPNQSIQSSSPTPPAGYVTDNTDCDDNNAAVHNTCGTGGSGGSGPHPTNCSDLSGQKTLHLVVNARAGVTIQVRGATVFWGNYNKDDSPALAWCGWWQDAGHYNNAPLLNAVQHLEADIPVAIIENGQDVLLTGLPQWMAWRGQVTLLDPGNTDIWHARYAFTINPIGAKAALQGDESCQFFFDGKAITDNYCRPLPGAGFHLVPNLTDGQNGQVDNPLN